MSIAQRAPDHVRGLASYVPGKPVAELAREMGREVASIVKLASNENPLGMSPHARAAVLAAVDELARYPDGNGYALKQAIASKYGVSADMLVLGNGSNDVLDLAARAFLAPGASSVFSQYAFAVYSLATQATGARAIEVPARFYAHDLAAMADAIAADTRVVFLANPNNPTGSFLPGALIEDFLAIVPPDVLVVLDEAYAEYLEPALQYDSMRWLARFPNLLITRTFSKIHGLAGLRVGFGVASAEVADLLNRVREPFNVSSLALAAAEAALADDAFVARSAELNRAGLAQLAAGFDALGLEYIRSTANFLTVRVGNAAAVNRRLLEQGVIVRPLASYGLPEWLRASVGLAQENARFLEALAVAIKG